MPRKKSEDSSLEPNSSGSSKKIEERVNHLEKDVAEIKQKVFLEDSNVKTSSSENEDVPKKKGSYLGVLVVLVILLLIVDIFSLYLFYKPNLNFNFISAGKVVQNPGNTGTTGCSDGTALNSCSTNKPYYCYHGTLVKNANHCGCPSGYKLNFQDCMNLDSS